MKGMKKGGGAGGEREVVRGRNGTRWHSGVTEAARGVTQWGGGEGRGRGPRTPGGRMRGNGGGEGGCVGEGGALGGVSGQERGGVSACAGERLAYHGGTPMEHGEVED